jgi:hypothetical protein
VNIARAWLSPKKHSTLVFGVVVHIFTPTIYVTRKSADFFQLTTAIRQCNISGVCTKQSLMMDEHNYVGDNSLADYDQAWERAESTQPSVRRHRTSSNNGVHMSTSDGGGRSPRTRRTSHKFGHRWTASNPNYSNSELSAQAFDALANMQRFVCTFLN